jgi:hypothetical protein
MLAFKNTVRIKNVSKPMQEIFNLLIEISEKIGKTMWITSANDSKHRDESYHYKNQALDIRTRHLFLNEIIYLSHNFSFFKVIFEWTEHINNEIIKHKAYYKDLGDEIFKQEVQNYLNSKNKKVSHLHIQWEV